MDIYRWGLREMLVAGEMDRERDRWIEIDRQGGINMDTSRYGGGWIQRGKDREVQGERQRYRILYYTASQTSWGLKLVKG